MIPCVPGFFPLYLYSIIIHKSEIDTFFIRLCQFSRYQYSKSFVIDSSFTFLFRPIAHLLCINRDVLSPDFLFTHLDTCHVYPNVHSSECLFPWIFIHPAIPSSSESSDIFHRRHCISSHSYFSLPFYEAVPE